jgi:hypothetical protein
MAQEGCASRAVMVSATPLPQAAGGTLHWDGRSGVCREVGPLTGSGSGQRSSLMRAVLEDALACFHRQYETDRRWVQREAREAGEWLFCNDAHGLFSYVSVCAVLGLEPESVRQELMRWSTSHPNTLQHSRATEADAGCPSMERMVVSTSEFANSAATSIVAVRR